MGLERAMWYNNIAFRLLGPYLMDKGGGSTVINFLWEEGG